MSAGNIRNELGPYKATKLWNDIVRIFRTGMPIGRHWRQLRAYDDTFVASEAVEWLFEFLQHHHNSGAELTRAQVIKLLQKFHRNNYIEDVKGGKYNSELFEENNRLFRFVALSPIKTPQWPRFKSATKAGPENKSSMSDLRTKKIFEDLEPSSPVACSNAASSVGQENRCPSYASSQSTCRSDRKFCPAANTDMMWKTVALERLETLLSHTDGCTVHQTLVALRHSYVKHNMTVLHKNGYVTGINRAELPPSWVISAMRYLAKWPDKEEDSFPEYVGFEKDVLVMVKDYFESLREPLTTYALYPVLIQAFHLVNKIRPSPIERQLNRVLHVSETTPQKYISAHPPRQPHREAPTSYRSKNRENLTHYRNPPSIPVMLSGRKAMEPREDVIVVYDGHTSSHHSPSQSAYHYLSDPSSSRTQSDISDSGRVGNSSHQQRNAARSDDSGSDYSNQPSKRRHRWMLHRPNMTRSASFSHLLGGSRVETAFVGDNAYTVYYGSHHKPSNRIESSLSSQMAGLSRAQSAYGIDQKPSLSQLPPFSNALSSRTVSTHYIPRDYESSSAVRRSTEYSRSHDQHNSISGRHQLSKHQSMRDINRQDTVEGARSHDVTEKYIDTGSIRLRFHSTPSIHIDDSLPYELFDDDYHSRLVECLQIILLFLPPSNRRVLHMLLKLLNKASSNRELVLDSSLSNQRLVTSLFWRCILCCENEGQVDTDTSLKIVRFLVENMEEILKVPVDLKCEVEKRIMKAKPPQEPKVTRYPTVLATRTNLPAEQERLLSKPTGLPAKAVGRLGITTPGRAFCEQITTEQYKNQANRVFEFSMKELLNNIVEDKKMTVKEKTKRLKQFQRTYPEIFAGKFPTADSVKLALDEFERNQPKVKQPLLSRPMNLLRKLR